MPLVVPPPANDDEIALQCLYRSAGVPSTAFNGIAPKGALCIDVTNADLYINKGTKATNDWTLVGPPEEGGG
ncbi:MAG TPA: hypothetical protein VK045_02555 [Ornithinicoccus sp.]|nr:hypothetical protein [Ornithinicoccus sp.]